MRIGRVNYDSFLVGLSAQHPMCELDKTVGPATEIALLSAITPRSLEMEAGLLELSDGARIASAERISLARLVKLTFDGSDMC